MKTEKINVKSCVLKKEGEKNGKAWKIYEITTDTGTKYDSFEEWAIGEHEAEITPDTSGKGYNGKISKKKAAVNFPRRDYTFDKRRVALECAVSLVNSGKIELTKLEAAREKFFNYLNS